MEKEKGKEKGKEKEKEKDILPTNHIFFVHFGSTLRFLIITYNILEISSNREYVWFFNSSAIIPSAYRKWIIEQHSKTEPLATIK